MAAGSTLRFRTQALADVEAAVQWYAQQAGMSLVDDFLAALETAYAHIAHHPSSGSPRWAAALKLEDVRGWRVPRFPHVVFYAEHDDTIEVWRVLHGARDIPATLIELDPFGA
jgi:toxin ParE1/3/4